MSQRIAVFGDLSGWTAPLYRALEDLGVDLATETIPEDLVIVQVGDLIHKGPDGNEAVAFVERMMQANPRRWVQLLGNHEAEHIGGHGFFTCDCDVETVNTLRRWVRSDSAHLGVALDVDDLGEVLVTHAGMVYELWKLLEKPSAADAAARLQSLLHTDQELAFSHGLHLKGSKPGLPGVLWALAGRELYHSWMRRKAAFHQVHGHTGAYDFYNGAWEPGLPDCPAEVDVRARHTLVHLGKKRFWGIDPCYTKRWSQAPLVPLVFHGEVSYPQR